MNIENMKYTHTHTHTHTMEYYLVIKKNGIFCSNMDEPDGIMLSKISRERQKFHLYIES